MAKDVAEVLGYTNSRKAISDHCKGGNETLLPLAGGLQKTKIIPQPDFYRLDNMSNLPAVEELVPLDGEVREKGTHIMSTPEPGLENSRLKRWY